MTLKANSCKGYVNKGTIHATTQYRTQRTLLPSMYASLKIFVSPRTSFHLFHFASLEAYRIRCLRVPPWKMVNGYMGYVGRKTRSERLVSAVISSLRCSGGPMKGPRRRKSQGIDWKSKLVKGRSGGKERDAHVGGYQALFRLYFPQRARIFPLFREDD